MTKKARSLSIILPVYNERSRILSGVQKAWELKKQWTGECEIIVVDDGSTDDCISLLENEDIVVLCLPHLGKGAAVSQGMLKANGQKVLFVDIDWSVPVEDVVSMLKWDDDLVIASRAIGGARRLGEPPWRHLVGKAFNRWIQWTLLSGYPDTQCGCKIFSQRAAQAIFPLVKEPGWAFDVEVLVLAHLLGFKVREFPGFWQYRSNSKIQIVRDGISMSQAILRIKGRLLQESYTVS